MGYKRYCENLITSSYTSSFSQSVIAGTTYYFGKEVHSMRLNLTGVLTNFTLTPPTSTAAQTVNAANIPALKSRILQVSAKPNAAGSFTMSYAVACQHNVLGTIANVTNGFFTGVIASSANYTAALSPTQGERIGMPGCNYYLTSTDHTGVMAVTVFYQIEGY